MAFGAEERLGGTVVGRRREACVLVGGPNLVGGDLPPLVDGKHIYFAPPRRGAGETYIGGFSRFVVVDGGAAGLRH